MIMTHTQQFCIKIKCTKEFHADSSNCFCHMHSSLHDRWNWGWNTEWSIWQLLAFCSRNCLVGWQSACSESHKVNRLKTTIITSAEFISMTQCMSDLVTSQLQEFFVFASNHGEIQYCITSVSF